MEQDLCDSEQVQLGTHLKGVKEVCVPKVIGIS
jgi:hypothetical protein